MSDTLEIRKDSLWKAYSKYKDSGINWLGKIPEHWEAKAIKRLCIVKRGASPRPIDDPIYFDEKGEAAWVRIADVSASERYLTQTEQRLSALGQSKSVTLNPRELFISIAGTVGKPIITKIKCCIHDGFVYFVGLKMNKEFLYYLFTAGEAYKGLGKLGTQLNLNTDTIGSIIIGVPLSDEQTAIVDFLERETAKIDALIVKKEQLIKLLEEKRTALISHAVTKGLDPNVPMKASGIEWIGKIPKHWEVKRLRFLLQDRGGIKIGPFGSALKLDFIRDEGFKVYGQEQVISADFTIGDKYVDESKFTELIACEILPGDLVVSMMGTTGKCQVVPANIERGIMDSHLIRLRPKDDIRNSFLARLVNESYYIRCQVVSNSRGSIMEGLNSAIIKELFILLPSSSEQTSIINFLNREASKIDALISRIREHILRLQEYRSALISAAVTGKIDVRGDAS